MCSILEEELGGTCETFMTSLDDSVFARVMFTINIKQNKDLKFDTDRIEQRLQEAGQTWQELLSQALSETYDDQTHVTSLAQKYGSAFPVGYTSRYRAKQAIFDIKKTEEAYESGKNSTCYGRHSTYHQA